MSEKTVRKIFISILIFLPIQYILVGVVGYYKSEPWPAFVFPGFKNVYETNETYLLPRTTFQTLDSSGNEIRSLSPNLFFEGIPRSQIDGLTRSLFRDREKVEQLSSEAKIFLLTNSQRLTNEEVQTVKVLYRQDQVRYIGGSIEIDSTRADTIGTIERGVSNERGSNE